MRIFSRNHFSRTLLVFLCILSTSLAWQWTDLLQTNAIFKSSDTLSLHEVSEMRVRDIKRRLARTHGYGADELGRMLDKKELIHALAFEEHKVQQVKNAEFQRQVFIQAIVVTVAAGALVLFWPLIRHVWEVAHVNFVVYTDRKRLEARRCWELQSLYGSIGVFCMFVVDFLSLWLTVSVILSWVTTSKYFFPIPSLPIRPAAMMGGQVSTGPLARYGVNVGPMVITWILRFLQGRLETWTGRALSNARRAQTKQTKKQRRENETVEEREARRAARRARRAAREEQEQRRTEEESLQRQQPEDTKHDDARKNDDDASFPGFNDMDTPKPSIDEKRKAAAAAAEARSNQEATNDSYTALDDLD